MSDVLLSAIINNAFWLVLFIVTVVLFRPQIQALIASIGSFSVAGGVFEFKGDQRATLESYTILTNILIEMLSEGGSANPLMDLISAASARQLQRFIRMYTKELPADDWNVELLKNVGVIF